MDSRQTMGDLKTKICSMLKVNPSTLLMRRGGRLGVEIKNLKEVIHKANMRSGAQVHLEFGHPSVEGEYRLEFSLAEVRNFTQDDLHDNLLYDFTDLFQLPISKKFKASEVCHKVVEFANRDLDLQLDIKNVRLRER